MQSFLKDILNDPPYNLARLANLLLIIGIVLLGSIFFLQTDRKDITLNLSLGSEEKIVVEGERQLAVVASQKLYPIAKVGQEIKRGDTLFVGMAPSQFQEMNNWTRDLRNGNFIPTKEMLDKYALPANIKKKMIDIAKEDAANKRPSKNSLSAADLERMKSVKEIISQLEQDVNELKTAIPKFEALSRDKEANYFNIRETKYANEEISLEQLKKEKEKWDEAIRDTDLRKNQLKRAAGELYEYNSELKFLANKKPAHKKKKNNNLVPFELDLANALDSLITSHLVLSTSHGKIASFGSLENTQIRDTLVYFEGHLEHANRGKSIIADAKRSEAKNIFVNSTSHIMLKDGSSILGTVKDLNDDRNGEKSIVRIDAEEDVSYVDIEEIIVPAKNTNFIEKVMQNF